MPEAAVLKFDRLLSSHYSSPNPPSDNFFEYLCEGGAAENGGEAKGGDEFGLTSARMRVSLGFVTWGLGFGVWIWGQCDMIHVSGVN